MEEKTLLVPRSIVNSLPAMVRNELAKMSAQKQEEFTEEFKRKGKTIGMAYLWLFIFAVHYGYMGNWGIQILFWLTCGGMWVWWVIDLFRVPGMIRNMNKDIATDIMRNLKAIST